VGVGIDVNFSAILKRRTKHPVSLNDRLDPNVVIIKIFPSLTREVLGCILNIKNLRGVILETYGSGNAPTDRWFIEILAAAIKRGVVIFNVSQCIGGKVIHGRYATSKMLEDIGVVSGGNITTEAAVTKMMYILGTETDIETIKKRLKKPVCGELDMS
jgi:L-asparaginase